MFFPANDVKFVVPIRQRPTIRNGKCIDAYWNEISRIKDVIVVLEIYSIKWMPCINLLEQKGWRCTNGRATLQDLATDHFAPCHTARARIC